MGQFIFPVQSKKENNRPCDFELFILRLLAAEASE